MGAIENLVVELSKDPFNPIKNFDVAIEYEKQNQTASAISFYLRTAEYGINTTPEYVYTSLLKLAKCFDDQNDRNHTVSNSLLQAIAYLPKRPEGYFLLARFHERLGNWQECYTFASVGASLKADNALPANVDFNDYCLLFEIAVSGWWLGRREESVTLFTRLLNDYDLTDEYKATVQRNLDSIA